MCTIPGMYSIHIVNRLLVDGINAIVYIYILPGEETWSLGILINWRENAAGSKHPLTYVLLRVLIKIDMLKKITYICILYHFATMRLCKYRKTFGISRALVGNKIVDNSDVVGASPVGAAPTTSSFST